MAEDTIENDVDIEVPEPPFNLSARGREIWILLYPLLAADNNVTSQEHWLLARYCDTQSEWEDLNTYRKDNQLFEKMKSSKGVDYYAKHPKISRLETIEQLLLRMEKQLGIGAKNITESGNKPPSGLEEIIKRLLTR